MRLSASSGPARPDLKTEYDRRPIGVAGAIDGGDPKHVATEAGVQSERRAACPHRPAVEAAAKARARLIRAEAKAEAPWRADAEQEAAWVRAELRAWRLAVDDPRRRPFATALRQVFRGELGVDFEAVRIRFD